MKHLILALSLVLSLAFGALSASAATEADPAYSVYGPFAGSSTNAAAYAYCTDITRGHDGGFVRNYRDAKAQRVHSFYCWDEVD